MFLTTGEHFQVSDHSGQCTWNVNALRQPESKVEKITYCTHIESHADFGTSTSM